MKKFKQVLACMVAVATLGTATCIPMGASAEDVGIGSIIDTTTNQYSQDFLDFVATYQAEQEKAIEEHGLNDAISLSGVQYNPNDFRVTYQNTLYYQNSKVVQYTGTIHNGIYFSSENGDLTVDDLFTAEQKEVFWYDYSDDAEWYEEHNISPIEVSSTYDEDTGLYSYYVYFRKYSGYEISMNDVMYTEYTMAQGWLDSGIVTEAHFTITTTLDDLNYFAMIDYAYVSMKDGSEVTVDTFKDYNVNSVELVTLDDGSTLNGETSYYKVNFYDPNDTDSVLGINDTILKLQQEDNVNFVVSDNWMSTALGKEDSYVNIPVVASSNANNPTVGDSTVTSLRDVNLDGEVNGLDLLMLKKYIIGLITW